MADKPLTDLKTFIENVNKKDKRNGKKIRFGFTKRKRKWIRNILAMTQVQRTWVLVIITFQSKSSRLAR